MHILNAPTASAVSSRSPQLLKWLKQSLCVSGKLEHYRSQHLICRQTGLGPHPAPSPVDSFHSCRKALDQPLESQHFFFLISFLGLFITSLLIFCSIKLFLCFFNFVCKKEKSLLKYTCKKSKILESHLLKSVSSYLFIFRSNIHHM